MMTQPTHEDEVQTKPAQWQTARRVADWDRVTDARESLGYRCEVRLVKEDVGFSTYVAQLEGVVSQGDTLATAIENTVEALQGCLHAYLENKMPIPWTEPQERAADELSFTVVVDG